MFEIISKCKPNGVQPEAIKELVEGINNGKKEKFLLVKSEPLFCNKGIFEVRLPLFLIKHSYIYKDML